MGEGVIDLLDFVETPRSYGVLLRKARSIEYTIRPKTQLSLTYV